VKVVKTSRTQRRHAEAEVRIHRLLERHDAARYRRFCARLLDTFVHAQLHFCMVFEALALSLRGLLVAGECRGLLLVDVQVITRQLLGCLAFIHSAGLAHTDLKCTNVMLRGADHDLVPHPRIRGGARHAPALRGRGEVVIIDFGMVTVPSEAYGRRVGARHVRAPEVVLGLRWGVSIDLWSLGCLLHTLYTGRRLFRAHDDMEHLAAMEATVEAKLPRSMGLQVADRIAAKGVAFDVSGRLLWPSRAPSSRAVDRVRRLRTLREQVLPRHDMFLELLEALLQLGPSARLDAEGAIAAPFVSSLPVVE